MIGFRFEEVMEGRVRLAGEVRDRPFRFRLDVEAPHLADLFVATAAGRAAGEVSVEGVAEGRPAEGVPAEGVIEMSPYRRRRIDYRFAFTGNDGRPYRFEGHKTIRHLRPYASWTRLPGHLIDAAGEPVGDALLRFSFRRHLAAFVWSFRPFRHRPGAAAARAA